MSAPQAPVPPTPGRVDVFRHEYGDPKPPNISRKVTACVLCRKHKVKCDLPTAGAPCTRCKKRGLSCNVKKSLQMLLESDASWKDRIEDEVGRLTDGMARLAEHLSMPELLDLTEHDKSAQKSPRQPGKALASSSPSLAMEHGGNIEPWCDATIEECGPAAIPATFISKVTRGPALVGLSSKQNIISRGILTTSEAQALFNYYTTKLDNYIYCALEQGTTFALLCKTSPLLLAAICAVTSLHQLDEIPYERCYEEFLNLIAAQTFSSRNSLDDIRAMCIGAFWLPDISWVLIGNAVRMATQMQLHHSYRDAISGDRKAYNAARLYYLVHVCDHQFSIAYGRPPLTGEYEAVMAADDFLKSRFAIEDDARLISQVKLCPVPENLVGQIQRFSLALDSCRLEWNEKFKPHAQIGNYPRKGVGLHHHFAKLYLCSHAFRGILTDDMGGGTRMSLEMREIADNAVLSATSILRSINTDTEFQSFMSDLPVYFDTMIAFSSVFLFRVSTSYAHTVQVDTAEVLLLLRQSVIVLEDIASKNRPVHLLARITDGLKQILHKFEEAQHQETHLTGQDAAGPADLDMSIQDEQHDWMISDGMDGFSMGNYDFLSNHQMNARFDTWYIEGGDEQPHTF